MLIAKYSGNNNDSRNLKKITLKKLKLKVKMTNNYNKLIIKKKSVNTKTVFEH